MSEAQYLAAANLVLTVHVLYVMFVVLGLVCVLAGGVLKWQWVRNPWFRSLHMLAIVVVVLQAWMGWTCPLTTLEAVLRVNAGDVTYSGSFVGYWLHKLLYYRAPPWVFMCVYTAFGAMVFGSWFWVAPNRFNAFRRDTH